MRSAMKPWAAVLAGAFIVSAPRAADAFLLVSKGKTPGSDKASVVVLREGAQTVLSIQMRTTEKDGEVALIIPVPVAVETKKLSGNALLALDQVSRPRVAEYWEADPCDVHPLMGPDVLPGGGATSTPTATSTSTATATPTATSTPTATPTATATPTSDYTIEFLEGKSGEVIAKLKGEGFTITSDEEPVLGSYVDSGMKLVVAKIDASKLSDGVLPPLLVHFESTDLTIPTKLFAAGGGRSLDIYTVASDRFEAKDGTNLAIPTNLDVLPVARSGLTAFYGGLRDHAFEKKPGALLTEYAWRASTCELCQAPLPVSALGPLGLGVLPSAKDGKQSEVIVNADQVSSSAGGPDEMRKALEACYAKTLADKPGVGGTISLAVAVADGKVTSAKPTDTSGDESLSKCAVDAATAAKLEKSGTLSIVFSPVSRKFFSQLVLTKLTARFDKAPDKDLGLKAARAIEGGREEGPQGKPEKKVYWAQSANDFQARYVIRHAWKGAMKCDSPERNVWSATDPNPKASAAKSADGDPKKIDSIVEGGLPDLDAYVIAASDAPAPPPPPPATSASAAPVAPPSASATPPASSATPSPTPDNSGCGACAVAATSRRSSPAVGLGLLMGLALWLRTKRKSRRLE